jgi:hypothetical protein
VDVDLVLITLLVDIAAAVAFNGRFNKMFGNGVELLGLEDEVLPA